jgi:hypothetical protein
MISLRNDKMKEKTTKSIFEDLIEKSSANTWDESSSFKS